MKKIEYHTDHELIRKYNRAIEHGEWGVGLSFDLRVDSHIVPVVTKEVQETGGKYEILYKESDGFVMFMDIDFPNSPYLKSEVGSLE